MKAIPSTGNILEYSPLDLLDQDHQVDQEHQ